MSREGWNPRKRRNHLHFIAEILKASKDGIPKTQVMYEANLSFTQLNQYLSLLLKLNLLKTQKRENKTIYKTTSRGTRFLQRYREIERLLNVLLTTKEASLAEHEQRTILAEFQSEKENC